MEEYFLCPQCNIATPSWFGFSSHFRLKHPGIEPPSKEEVEKAKEIPEGYVPSKWAGREKKPKAEKPTPTIKETKIPEELPGELPEDFTERAKLSLTTNEIPPKLINQVISKIKWHPLVMENANAFSNMLTSIFGASIEGRKHMAKIGWIISEVFGEPVGAGGTFVGGGQPGAGYTGIYGQPGYGGWGQSQQDPFSRYMDYILQKDMRTETGKERPAGLPPEVSKEIDTVRSENKEIRDFMGKLLERLNKQEEEEKYESRFGELRGTIAKLEEKLESKPKEGEQNQWLKSYLDERDKRETEMHDRYQSTIKEMGDKLANATKEIAMVKRESDSSVIEAIKRDKDTHDEVVKQLKDAGWKPKDKTKEELDHDLLMEGIKILPEKIDKGFDKIVDKISLGGQPATNTAPETRPSRSVSEVAEQVSLENEILDEAKRRGKA